MLTQAPRLLLPSERYNVYATAQQWDEIFFVLGGLGDGSRGVTGDCDFRKL